MWLDIVNSSIIVEVKQNKEHAARFMRMESAQGQSPTSRLHLLSLPPEIRLLIYKYYTAKLHARPVQRLIVPDLDERWTPRLFEYGSYGKKLSTPTLLMVNEQIYQEYRKELEDHLFTTCRVIHIGPNPDLLATPCLSTTRATNTERPCTLEFILDVSMSSATAAEVSLRFNNMLAHASILLTSLLNNHSNINALS